MRKTIRILPAVLVAGLLAAPVMLRAGDTHTSDDGYKSSQATKSAKKEAKTAAKLSDAEAVLKAAAESKDEGVPRDLLEKAKCVGVFPSFKKVALGVGGEGGKGVFTCRTDHGMSGPAIYKIGGGSVGWQAGVKEADLVLLVMDDEGMNKLLNDDHVEIGTDLSATAGPVGHDAKTTDTQSSAQLLAWSRTHGAFAGASLDGLNLKQDEDDNAELYHRTVGAKEILTTDTDTLPVPQVAQSFVKTTEQYM